ncbi:hypothetical protein DXG01_009784 [Tephrocybe rancida]|nr:hypothetical protein DXG01_009784 [Tephrocybe rancida]
MSYLEVKEHLESVKQSMKKDDLEAAISLLQDFILCDQETEICKIQARRHLIKALHIRFACHRWSQDFEDCFNLNVENIVKSSDIQKTTENEICDESIEFAAALDLLTKCRLSIDPGKLDAAIRVAQRAILTANTDHEQIIFVDLLIMLGNVLVLRYLLRHEVISLDQASIVFEKALSVALKDTRRGSCSGYVCLVGLGHIELLKFTEAGSLDSDAFDKMSLYLNEVDERDGEMVASLDEGIEMLDCDDDSESHLQAVNGLKKFLSSIPESHPKRARVLLKVANALSARFNQTGDVMNLDESLALSRESVSLRPFPHPERYSALNTLASVLQTRYEQNGDINDLEEAVALSRKSLLLMPARAIAHRDHCLMLENLSIALWSQFQQKGDVEDLEESLTLLRKSLASMPDTPQSRSLSQNNLANILWTRFSQKGSAEDLEESILLSKKSLFQMPTPHPAMLTNLGNALLSRFRRKGDDQDLKESIMSYQKSLSLMLATTHPGRPVLLNSLAGALMTQYEQTDGDMQDLKKCISLFEEGLASITPLHPARPLIIDNLGTAVLKKFERTQDLDDLKDCIALYDLSLSLRPPLHPERSVSLNNLSGALRTKFRHDRNFQDLEKAIMLLNESLSLIPAPHPHRSPSLENLAHALLTQFISKPNPTANDKITAFKYLSEAARYESGSLLVRLEISKLWANVAREHNHPSVPDAYQCAIDILPLLASLDLTLQQRQSVLTNAGDLASDAAQYAISQNQLDTAIISLSTGRSVFWSQGLKLRAPLDNLAAKDRDLAERIHNISQQLENAAHTPTAASAYSFRLVPDTLDPVRILSLMGDWTQALQEARSIDGFQDFLQPPSFGSLLGAARRGPIILFNASQYGCDALILTQTEVPVQIVPLPKIDLKRLKRLKEVVQLLSVGVAINSTIIGDIKQILEDNTAAHRDTVPSSNESELNNSKASTQRHQSKGGRFQKPVAVQSAFRLVLKVLWATIMQPIISALELEKTDSPKRIWLCPTGLFSFLPIHAAGIYSDSEDATCLSDYVISSYCSSPQDLVTAEAEMPSPFRIFAVIEPNSIDGNRPLSYTVDELEKIKAHLPDLNDLIPYGNSEGLLTSLDTVLANIRQSSCVHIGCHGNQHPTDPLKSSLLLSGGKLTMARIIQEGQRSGASARLAYLSACDTARGDEKRPDESLNLVASMMFAGFKSVVGTMWSIQDKDGPVVADEFYNHLLRNGKVKGPEITDAAEALHRAVKALRAQRRRYGDWVPFKDWVPFVHFGI